jgi:hypothetical protein
LHVDVVEVNPQTARMAVAYALTANLALDYFGDTLTKRVPRKEMPDNGYGEVDGTYIVPSAERTESSVRVKKGLFSGSFPMFSAISNFFPVFCGMLGKGHSSGSKRR